MPHGPGVYRSFRRTDTGESDVTISHRLPRCPSHWEGGAKNFQKGQVKILRIEVVGVPSVEAASPPNRYRSWLFDTAKMRYVQSLTQK